MRTARGVAHNELNREELVRHIPFLIGKRDHSLRRKHPKLPPVAVMLAIYATLSPAQEQQR